MNTRAVIIISGTVQNVGYRITVHKAAFELDLVGYAKNRDDGTVEVVVEGPKKNIEQLARKINIKRFPTKVETIRRTYSRPTGEYSNFTVIRDERIDGDLSGKLDLGLVYIQDMDEHLSEAITGVGTDVKSAGQNVKSVGRVVKGVRMAVDGVGRDVKNMDSTMVKSFGRLEKKYDSFGRTMKGMAKDIKATRKDTKGMVHGIKNVAADIKVIREATTRAGKKKVPA